jgi:hypothetical protein
MAERLIEPLPQVDVLDRLLVRRAPAVLFPAVNPGCDSASSAEIAAINSMRLFVVCGSPPISSFS